MHGGEATKLVENFTPKTRHALRLVAAGVHTAREASRLIGRNPGYITNLKKVNPHVRAYLKKLEDDIDAGTVNMSVAMQELGRKGIVMIARMMEAEGVVKDELRLKAAMDLADRSPETSKTSKISVEGDLTLRQGDAAALMSALVEAAEASRTYRAEVSQGDYVKIDDGSALTPMLPPPQGGVSRDSDNGSR